MFSSIKEFGSGILDISNKGKKEVSVKLSININKITTVIIVIIIVCNVFIDIINISLEANEVT